MSRRPPNRPLINPALNNPVEDKIVIGTPTEVRVLGQLPLEPDTKNPAPYWEQVLALAGENIRTAKAESDKLLKAVSVVQHYGIPVGCDALERETKIITDEIARQRRVAMQEIVGRWTEAAHDSSAILATLDAAKQEHDRLIQVAISAKVFA